MSNLKKVFLFVIIIGLGFLVLDAILWLNSGKLKVERATTKESIWIKRKEQIDNLKSPVDIIFLGDSTVQAGIDESVILEKTGLRTLNLGLTGDMISYGDYKVLSYYLDRFEPPRYIIYWKTIDVWERSLKPFYFAFLEPSFSEVLDYSKGILKRRNSYKAPVELTVILLDVVMTRFLASYKYKTWFRKKQTEYLEIRGKKDKTIPISKALVFSDVSHLRNWPVVFSQDSREWFSKLVKLAEEKQIQFFWSAPTLHKIFGENKELKPFSKKHLQGINKFYSSFKSVIPINKDFFYFSDEDTFANKDHVNENGKRKVSEFYADLLNTRIR